ncbi:MAG: hydantoinase/oxoprolinase family protein [Acidobacteriota bacterium]
MVAAPRWRIWIDTGGTFTDCLAIGPDGQARRAKVLSSAALRGRLSRRLDHDRIAIDAAWRAFPGLLDGCELRWLASGEAARVLAGDGAELLLAAPPPPGIAPGSTFEIRSGEEAPVLAARLVTGTPRGRALPPADFRLATTRGTNALLERRGARVALFLTAGFGDLLEIGTQQRPDLFALEVRKRAPLYEAVGEVPERLAADGAVLAELDEAAVVAAAGELHARGIESAAVALLHSYREPAHERRVAEILRRAGWRRVVLSSEVAPFLRILPRAETAVVEAYLAPLLEDYLGRVEAAVGDGRLRVMTSAGGLVRSAAFRAKDGLLSGPAGGVVGAAEMARRSGIERLIAFDMGGTSTDVSRYDGAYDYDFETRVGDAHLQAPTLAIESVAAGGGSVCSTDGFQLRVGPESAGADPGPACYGAGGPLTLTDVNLLLGRVAGERFAIPLVPDAAERALAGVETSLGATAADARPALLAGFLAIANERMAEAIRRVSVRRGFDPRGAALVAFGGAGGQHACAVAELLGMTTVLVPPDAGLLSAFGLGAAAIERIAERQVLRRLDELGPELRRLLDELEGEARDRLAAEGELAGSTRVRRLAFLRLQGQDASLQLDLDRGDGDRDVVARFASIHLETFGYPPPDRPLEVEALRVVASAAPAIERRSHAELTASAARPSGPPTRAWFGDLWQATPFFRREDLDRGAGAAGPALVVDAHSTTVVEPGWSFLIDAAGALVMRRGGL